MSALTQPVTWIPVTIRKPDACTPVIGYAKAWKDEDFNPEGQRECFLEDQGTWISAAWNDSQDCWDTDDTSAPTHWMHRPKTPTQLTEEQNER